MSASSSGSSFSVLLRLLRYAGHLRGRVAWATFCSVTNKIFDIAPEILIGIAIDVVVSQDESFLAGLGVVDPLHQITVLGVLTLLVWGGESLFEYFYLLAWRNLAQVLQHELRMDAYSHVQRLDLAYFEDKSTGNLVSILNDDVNQLERFLNGGANSLIQVATALVGVGSVFFVISPFIAAFAFTPIPIIVVGAFYFQRRAQPLYAEVRDRVGVLGGRLQNNLSGMMTIRAFSAEEREVAALGDDSNAYMEANRKAISISSAFIPVIRMAVLAGFLATFVIGGRMAIAGTLPVGSYGLLVFLTQRLLWPLTGLAETVDLYERAMASTRRILDLLKTPVSIVDAEGAESLPTVEGNITLKGVDFAYATGGRVIEDLSLEVRAGQTVAFVGATGSGKSTLMKLILRFYEPTSGSIELDGRPLTTVPMADLRRSMALVSQDVFLFHGTVRENIAYGRPDATADEIEAAARAAEAHDFIMRLPEGYDTVVGERGQKLSGGQRQRLSIARAVLTRPAILILDEATSAVDNETEAAIQRSMEQIAKGRTVLVIAHRLSTIVGADRICVLEAGRLVESGTHDELAAAAGAYARLWDVQTGGDRVA